MTKPNSKKFESTDVEIEPQNPFQAIWLKISIGKSKDVKMESTPFHSKTLLILVGWMLLCVNLILSTEIFITPVFYLIWGKLPELVISLEKVIIVLLEEVGGFY